MCLIIVFTRIEYDVVDEFDAISKGFMNEMHAEFMNSKHVKIPVLPIGFKISENKFTKFCSDFMSVAHHTKLICRKMVSPIHKLRKRRRRLEGDIQRLNAQINKVNSEIDHLTREVIVIQNKTNNPESWVLGRDVQD
eukprot:517431_1